LIVLDSSALVAILRDEPDAPIFRDIIADAMGLAISAFTLFECRTVLWGRFGSASVADLDLLIEASRTVVHSFDARQSALAFDAYRRFGKGSGHPARLNLGDCAAYALATSLDMPLLFKGSDFSYTDVRPALASP
jgi:ribonuclease VapC